MAKRRSLRSTLRVRAMHIDDARRSELREGPARETIALLDGHDEVLQWFKVSLSGERGA